MCIEQDVEKKGVPKLGMVLIEDVFELEQFVSVAQKNYHCKWWHTSIEMVYDHAESMNAKWVKQNIEMRILKIDENCVNWNEMNNERNEMKKEHIVWTMHGKDGIKNWKYENMRKMSIDEFVQEQCDHVQYDLFWELFMVEKMNVWKNCQCDWSVDVLNSLCASKVYMCFMEKAMLFILKTVENKWMFEKGGQCDWIVKTVGVLKLMLSLLDVWQNFKECE